MTSHPFSADAVRTAAHGPLYIDVRSPGEYASGWIDGAVNVPLGELESRIRTLAPDPHRELILYCASGARSEFGCALLQQSGYTHVRNGGGVGSLALTCGRPLRRA
jgi:phage shock protein E